MSKETAILFPFFLLIINVVKKKTFLLKNNLLSLFPYFLFCLFFVFIFKFGVKEVINIDTYKIQFNPKLIINNFLWYGLWSLGLPNFMPNYSTHLFFSPTLDFWKLFNTDTNLRIYIISLISFILLSFLSLIVLLKKETKQIKTLFFWLLFCLIGFFIFISPTLPIIHRWMVRLTIPLIFVSLIQAFFLSKLVLVNQKKKLILLGFLLIFIYLFWNFYSIKVHESSSTYLLETKIADNLYQDLKKNKSLVNTDFYKYIFFQDIKTNSNWSHSQKLKVSFNDQLFLYYYLPGKKITALYGFESSKPKEYVFVINAASLYR